MKRVYLVAAALLLTLCFSERSLYAQEESVDFKHHEFRLGAAWRPFFADLTLGTNKDIDDKPRRRRILPLRWRRGLFIVLRYNCLSHCPVGDGAGLG